MATLKERSFAGRWVRLTEFRSGTDIREYVSDAPANHDGEAEFISAPLGVYEVSISDSHTGPFAPPSDGRLRFYVVGGWPEFR